MITKISGDTSSGALELTFTAYRCIQKIGTSLIQGEIDSVRGLELSSELKKAKSEMISVVNLVDRFISDAGTFQREEVAKALAFTEEVVGKEREAPSWIFSQIRSLFEGKKGKILLYSFSSTVLGVIPLMGKVGEIEVITSEGRPTGDGKRVVEKLKGTDIPVTFLTDGALMSSVSEVDMAFLGTDGWSENYFLNKVGTKALVELLDMHGRQAFVFASPLKKSRDEHLLSLPLKRYNEGELLEEKWNKVSVINRYFEIVPRYPNVTLFSQP